MMITVRNIDTIKPYEKNPRINDEAVQAVANSIKQFGFKVPIVIDSDGVIVAGHTRYKAAKLLEIDEVPCIIADDLSPEKIKAFRLADNKVAELSKWDFGLLEQELEDLRFADLDFEMSDFGFELSDDSIMIDEETLGDDEVPETDEDETDSQIGEMYELGNSILMCGDSTNAEDVAHLMGGEKADLVFTDPPYGMKKENEGVLNDNLNFDDLLDFNKKWIPLSFEHLKENGSWYCWGIDEPLMDIYSNILKPMARKNKITFRNLLTWDKGNGQGQLSEDFRMFPIADEKCLFVMSGVQGFNNNQDNYFEKWEPIRKYINDELEKIGVKKGKQFEKILGSVNKSQHILSKSYFNLITEADYIKLQNYANGRAFKKEYDEIKKEYYSTRAYFNNTHDNMNNVWHFERTSQREKEDTGEHATPKPIALCERAIKSSSRVEDLVLDLFGGSGSTLIACEKLNRRCRMIELSPHYCDVIRKRYTKWAKDNNRPITSGCLE